MDGDNATALKELLLVYAAVLVINVVLSGFLWARYRNTLHRNLFLVWAAAVVSLVFQGLLSSSPALIAIAFLTSFPVSLALAALLGAVLELEMRRAFRVYAAGLGGAVVLAGAATALRLPFWTMALGPALAVALPVFDVAIRAFWSRAEQMSTTAKAGAVACIVLGLHHLDFPFLRDKPQMAVLGFSLALLVVFALSTTLPAIVLERVTSERTRIEHLGQLRARFFANVSHDLRTPLTIILATLEGLLAEEFGPLTPTQHAYLKTNQRNAVRLLKLINDLLDLSKKEEGFLRLRLQRTDLRDLLQDIVAFARPLAARKNLALGLEIRALPADLHVDVEKLERAIVNLVSNALKFTHQGGVTMSLDCKEGWVELVVTDSGIGITAEVLPHIFERFSQGDGSVTRKYGGSGIGLAFSKEIVDLHGGLLTVESTPGQGSRFVIRLREGAKVVPEEVRDRRVNDAPEGQTELRRHDDQEPKEWAQRLQSGQEYRFGDLADATERRAVTRKEAPALAARILLVEDHADILEIVNLQLRERYEIYVGRNGKEGLELATRERPDLIITDFMMPEMDGLTMVQQLRADPRFAETPIIMLTAKNNLEDRLAVRSAGVDIYLGKPFSPRELQAAVEQMLAKRGRHVNNLMRAHAEGLEIVSGGLAHEIQNPLNFVKGAQIMIFEQITKIRDEIAGAALTDQGRLIAIDRAKQKIDRLVRSATEGVTRIEGVVALIRRYARDGYPKEEAEVLFDQTVKEVAQLVAPPIDAECQVELDLQTRDGQVRLIPEEFNQVIRSLVQNAIEADPKGRVAVRTRNEGQQLVLEVTDNGPGIPAEQLTKIFSPFFTTKTGNGRGLGLSIAQLAVSRAGGSIEVASTPNAETTFRVRLPALAAESASVPATAKAQTDPERTAARN